MINDHSRITVFNGWRQVVDLPAKGLEPPRKTYRLPSKPPQPRVMSEEVSSSSLLSILGSIDVCSKRFLTSKVDRSVGGLVAQQQCVGPHHVPISDVAVVAHSFFGFEGAATAIGEQPIQMLHYGIHKGVRKAIAEMCTNLVWAPITAFADIKCSVNWMWPARTPEGKALLLQAVKVMSDVMCLLGIAIDGGKDSVSMTTTLPNGTIVDSPPQVVVSGYAACTDIRQTVTGGFKNVGSDVWLLKCNVEQIPEIFESVQHLIRKDWIVAGHDVSDGGLLTTLAEMCFASEDNYGFHYSNSKMFPSFVQAAADADAAIVFETALCVASIDVLSTFECWSIEALGCVTLESTLCGVPVRDYRDAWERPATEMEKQQTMNGVADLEHRFIYMDPKPPSYQLPIDCLKRLKSIVRSLDGIPNSTPDGTGHFRPRVAVIRGEGSNGDREMSAALWMAGFEVHDVTTSDMTNGRIQSLDPFGMVVFVGGFTYSDALGAATGWAAVLTKNERAHKMLDAFRARQDTLILGVCNGCQLLTRLGWMGTTPFQMEHNTSGRFESRFVTVELTGDDVWFRGMDGTRMGVWVAHGEGRFPSDRIPSDNRSDMPRATMHYVDAGGAHTMQYPLNPNGSPDGVAGITSADGRMLAMMPHPERCVKRWQLPWMPAEIRELHTEKDYSPWMLLFRNAFEWCLNINQIVS